MVRQALLWALTASMLSTTTAWIGVTKTNWDCCKPACAWQQNLRTGGASGYVKVCNRNDQPLSSSQSQSEESACANNAGNGFLCSSYQPRPLTNDLSIGFAVMGDTRDCCECFEVEWLSGPARGKRIQVQQINSGVERNEVVIIVGGGVGPNQKGCQTQFGYGWGRQYGGVDSADDCEALPDHLKGGCYWRWNWARGDVNDWPVNVRNITCPRALTEISGCDSGGRGPSGRKRGTASLGQEFVGAT